MFNVEFDDKHCLYEICDDKDGKTHFFFTNGNNLAYAFLVLIFDEKGIVFNPKEDHSKILDIQEMSKNVLFSQIHHPIAMKYPRKSELKTEEIKDSKYFKKINDDSIEYLPYCSLEENNKILEQILIAECNDKSFSPQ